MRPAPLAVSAEIRALLASVLLLAGPAPLRADSSIEDNEDSFASMEFETVEKANWRFYVSAFGGYNQLLEGYDNYENLGNVGLEFWVHPVKKTIEEASWGTNNFMLRITAEWMPLQVPKGNYGLTEDLYAAYAQMLYKFDLNGDANWAPYIAVGAGSYMDRTTLDTPATGKISGDTLFFGFNGSLGLFWPALGPIRPAMEARYHRLRGPDNFSPQNVTYHGSLIFGFGAGGADE